MPAGGKEQAKGKLGRVGEPRRQRVGFEMVDGDQRFLGDERDALGGGEADDDAADQPGAGRRRDAIEHAEACLRLEHRLGDDQVEHFHVGARRDLGNHAAIRRVLGGLRQHDVGKDFATPGRLVAAHHRGGGLVAGRLDAENEHLLPMRARFARVRVVRGQRRPLQH
jgi:hypothetical protein